MKQWRHVAVFINTKIRQAIDIIDKSALQIALVVDQDDTLLGTVTDGDIRRGLLTGIDIDQPICKVYNNTPITAKEGDDLRALHTLMRKKYICQVPVLDARGRVICLEVLKDVLNEERRKNSVVLMAGGLGTRLQPFTKDCPKPLLSVGGKPVLETILLNFIRYGFEKIYLSVNYKSEMIEDYFEDGSKWGISIQYLKENQRLGTAGGLSLIPEKPDKPFIVMNGDLLTKINFGTLIDFHCQAHIQDHSLATMCVREYNMQIPYGVIQRNENRLMRIDEKPLHKFFVNAGIYVLEPEMLDFVPDSSYFDMTDLFQEILKHNKRATVFPIREYWMDIGRRRDFEEANIIYEEIFAEQNQA